MKQERPFCIPKQQVWEVYKRVKANKGAAGVDGQTLADFEVDLRNNLYKIWNRMSSGSYFAPPILRVEIPKKDGGVRPLGIPTVADRIAQMVVKIQLEPALEKHFHQDSYGYRPRKSALDAVGQARKRCWKYNWVLDLDIKGFFNNIDHDLMMQQWQSGKRPVHGIWPNVVTCNWRRWPRESIQSFVVGLTTMAASTSQHFTRF